MRGEASERQSRGDERLFDERSLDERQEVVGSSWSKLKRWRLKREMEERRATERAAKR